MKTSILTRKGASQQLVDLVARLVNLFRWPVRRYSMGDVTMTLLDGKLRVAEDVFGWNRATVELGMNEFRARILCVNDLSARRKPKAEEKDPTLLGDIIETMDPHREAEPRLRTVIKTKVQKKPQRGCDFRERQGKERPGRC
jgi:hypothetical protein